MVEPYYQDSHVQIFHGDCRNILPEIGPFETCITDPPYDLTTNKMGGSGPASLNTKSPAGRSRIGTGGGFMGKEWDATGVAFDLETWRLISDALLPGAMCLAFGGTRTHHRLMCGIEDAGFELRDCMMYLYGSGFPKSLDIGKAIDKARRRDFVAAAIKLGIQVPGNSHHDWTEGGHAPGDTWWSRFKEVLSEEQWGEIERTVIGYNRGRSTAPYGGGHYVGDYEPITAPATEAAKLWDGWGTALKPAWEPIVVAMKPLEGTFANNALEHGVAGLNVDGARIAAPPGDREDYGLDGNESAGRNRNAYSPHDADRTPYERPAAGRWPANLVLDEEAAALLDGESGERSAGAPVKGTEPSRTGVNTYGDYDRVPFAAYGDSGGASRFFYTAKASRSDRGEGNDHPTVKPSDLLKWLCKLTATPTGGTILDPFMGSGTTVYAAKEMGRKAVGIELEERYAEIAAERLSQGVLDLASREIAR